MGLIENGKWEKQSCLKVIGMKQVLARFIDFSNAENLHVRQSAEKITMIRRDEADNSIFQWKKLY